MANIIRSDYKWKRFKTRDKVPKKILATFTGYERDTGWLKYKDIWYHVSEFLRIEGGGWDGGCYVCASFSVLIKISPDRESYMMATLFF